MSASSKKKLRKEQNAALLTEKQQQAQKEAKKNKDFALADQIRDELLERNIKLIDTREGTKFEIIKD